MTNCGPYIACEKPLSNLCLHQRCSRVRSTRGTGRNWPGRVKIFVNYGGSGGKFYQFIFAFSKIAFVFKHVFKITAGRVSLQMYFCLFLKLLLFSKIKHVVMFKWFYYNFVVERMFYFIVHYAYFSCMSYLQDFTFEKYKLNNMNDVKTVFSKK